MQKLIDFVLKYKNYISFVSLVIISLSMISIGGTTRIGGFRTIVIGSVGWLQSLFSWIPNPAALKSENTSLRELNLELSSEVIRMRKAMIENENLRRQLNLKERFADSHIRAEVVGKTTIELRNYITLDRGESDGIQEGMSVRTDAGLVGVVIGTSGNFSLVELVVNPDIKIAAKVLNKNLLEGLVSWNGGEEFTMRNILKTAQIEKGDVIITSSYSNKYPDFVPIGEVYSVEEDPGSIFYRVKIKSYVNFQTREQVFVIKYIPNPEMKKLIEDIEAKIKARKSR